MDRPRTLGGGYDGSGSSRTSTTSCSGVSRRHLRTDLDLVVTAQQVRSYKPDPAHFKECARRIGGKKGWVHIGSGYDADVAPLLKMKVPVIWVNRHGEKLEGRKKPDRGGQDLPRRGEEARCRRLTRRDRTATRQWRLNGGAPRLPPQDPADEAMVARARERFAAERRHLDRRRRQAERRGALPNLIVIGGLKCGTTSLHHYLNLHPQIAMSRPKELNFFVAELNWELGSEWYASHFDARAASAARPRPHYTNLPRFAGVAERMRELLGDGARLVYMVRDPIERMLSHYLHNVGGGYESRPIAEALADPDSRLRPPQPLRDAARALPGGVRA